MRVRNTKLHCSTFIALLLIYGSGTAADAQIGYLDSANCEFAGGWAKDPNSSDPISVHLWFDNDSNWVRGTTANLYRADLAAAGIGNGYHAFEYYYDEDLLQMLCDGGSHQVRAYGITGNNPELGLSPKTISCGYFVNTGGNYACCSSPSQVVDTNGNCVDPSYYKTFDRYTSATTIVNLTLSVSAYCPADNMCVDKNSACVTQYTAGTLSSANVDDRVSYCGGGSNPDAWIDCDYSSARCSECGSLSGVTTAWTEAGDSGVGEYGTGDGGSGTIECCGDDKNEFIITDGGLTACCGSSDDTLDAGGNCVSSGSGYYKTYERYTGGTTIVNRTLSVNATCPADNMCVDENSACVAQNAAGTLSSSNVDDRVAYCGGGSNPDAWIDCDYISSRCSKCGSLSGVTTAWIEAGETGVGEYGAGNGGSGSTECCGDDADEVNRHFLNYGGATCDDVTYERCVNGGDDPADAACCNDDDDCVYDATCYSEGSSVDLTGNGRIDGWCMTSNNHKGKWRDCDDSVNRCGGGCGANWSAGGETSAFGEYDSGTAEECCGDDSGEYFVTYDGKTACCDSGDDTIDASGMCVATTGCEPTAYVPPTIDYYTGFSCIPGGGTPIPPPDKITSLDNNVTVGVSQRYGGAIVYYKDLRIPDSTPYSHGNIIDYSNGGTTLSTPLWTLPDDSVETSYCYEGQKTGGECPGSLPFNNPTQGGYYSHNGGNPNPHTISVNSNKINVSARLVNYNFAYASAQQGSDPRSYCPDATNYGEWQTDFWQDNEISFHPTQQDVVVVKVKVTYCKDDNPGCRDTNAVTQDNQLSTLFALGNKHPDVTTRGPYTQLAYRDSSGVYQYLSNPTSHVGLGKVTPEENWVAVLQDNGEGVGVMVESYVPIAGLGGYSMTSWPSVSAIQPELNRFSSSGVTRKTSVQVECRSFNGVRYEFQPGGWYEFTTYYATGTLNEIRTKLLAVASP